MLIKNLQESKRNVEQQYERSGTGPRRFGQESGNMLIGVENK